jgi:hypothetical protein
MSISKRLRYEILRRDNHACRYCGMSAPDVKLTVDHVVPVALGGTDKPSNLVTACEPCNSGKSATPADSPIVDDVAADALRWARALAQAAELSRANLKTRMRRRAIFRDSMWGEWSYTSGPLQGKPVDLPAGWEDSVDRFVDAGLSEEDFFEAIRLAMTRKLDANATFKYMCGVLWRILRERQEIAMQIVDDERASDGS